MGATLWEKSKLKKYNFYEVIKCGKSHDNELFSLSFIQLNGANEIVLFYEISEIVYIISL